VRGRGTACAHARIVGPLEVGAGKERRGGEERCTLIGKSSLDLLPRLRQFVVMVPH